MSASPDPLAALAALVHRHVDDGYGDAPCLQDVGGAVRTYAETASRIRGWGATFQRLGVSRGDRVAIMLENSFEAVETWAGAGWIGAVDVPVHTELRGSMLRHVLADSGASVVVVEAEHLAWIEAVKDELPGLTVIVVDRGTDVAVSDDDTTAGDRVVQDHELATILYTSGTTGPSKGVMLPAAYYRSSLLPLYPDLTRRDVGYVPLPLYHVAGRTATYSALHAGGSVVLRRRFSVSEFWPDVSRFGATFTTFVGAMADMLWTATKDAAPDHNTLTKVLMSPLATNFREFADRFGVRLRTNFGMTEVGGPIVGGITGELVDGSCGRLRPGIACRVVDDLDREVPAGVVGELVVRSDEPWALMGGYWADPAKTVAAWRNLWFHTGDAFRQDADGNWYFVDRMKDVIRRRGENISSFHLEAEITSHPGVEACAVVGVPIGEGEEEIRAVIVRTPGADVTADDVWQFLDGRVARFMMPRYVTFVDELPRTPSLRVKKAELRALSMAGTHDRSA